MEDFGAIGVEIIKTDAFCDFVIGAVVAVGTAVVVAGAEVLVGFGAELAAASGVDGNVGDGMAVGTSVAA